MVIQNEPSPSLGIAVAAEPFRDQSLPSTPAPFVLAAAAIGGGARASQSATQTAPAEPDRLSFDATFDFEVMHRRYRSVGQHQRFSIAVEGSALRHARYSAESGPAGGRRHGDT